MTALSMEFETYQRLIEMIYASALDQQRWDHFLNELSVASGGVAVHLSGEYYKENINIGLRYAGYDDASIRSYLTHYDQLNPWVPAIGSASVGVATAAEQYVAKPDLLRTEFYNDWIRPQGDIGSGGGIVLYKDASRFFMVGGHLSFDRQERLQGDWLTLLQWMAPHLQNAIEIWKELDCAAFETVALDRADRDLRAAVFVIDDGGRLAFQNESGQRLREEDRVFESGLRGGLRMRDPHADAVFQKSLKSLQDPAQSLGAVLKLSDQEGRLTHVCRISRFSPDGLTYSPFGNGLFLHGPSLLMTVSKIEPDDSIGAGLRAIYGLSESEVEVALAVAEGATLQDIAERRAASLHTVRNQVKSLQAKTETHRQSELVSLIERMRHLGGN